MTSCSEQEHGGGLYIGNRIYLPLLADVWMHLNQIEKLLSPQADIEPSSVVHLCLFTWTEQDSEIATQFFCDLNYKEEENSCDLSNLNHLFSITSPSFLCAKNGCFHYDYPKKILAQLMDDTDKYTMAIPCLHGTTYNFVIAGLLLCSTENCISYTIYEDIMLICRELGSLFYHSWFFLSTLEETALANMHKKIQAEKKQMDFLFTSMSHELTTSLQTVIGVTSHFLQQEHRYSPEIITGFKAVDEANVRMINIVSDVLDISLMQQNKLQLTDTSFYMKDVLQKAKRVTQYDAKTHNVKVKVQYVPSYSLFQNKEKDEQLVLISGDEARLLQILVNLVSNAIKYSHGSEKDKDVSLTRSGGEEPKSKRVYVKYSCEHRQTDKKELLYTIDVVDEGIGIPEHLLKDNSLFDPFTRGTGSQAQAQRSYMGSGGCNIGLGLCIVDKLSSLMGGSVEILWSNTKHSLKEPLGTCFRLVFPFSMVTTKKKCVRPLQQQPRPLSSGNAELYEYALNSTFSSKHKTSSRLFIYIFDPDVPSFCFLLKTFLEQLYQSQIIRSLYHENHDASMSEVYVRPQNISCFKTAEVLLDTLSTQMESLHSKDQIIVFMNAHADSALALTKEMRQMQQGHKKRTNSPLPLRPYKSSGEVLSCPGKSPKKNKLGVADYLRKKWTPSKKRSVATMVKSDLTVPVYPNPPASPKVITCRKRDGVSPMCHEKKEKNVHLFAISSGAPLNNSSACPLFDGIFTMPITFDKVKSFVECDKYKNLFFFKMQSSSSDSFCDY